MPDVLWWGTNAPKIKRQKKNGTWADDTTYTKGNENGHTYNLGTDTDLEIIAQLNYFVPEPRRVLVLQNGDLKVYRAGSSANNWRGTFSIDFRLTRDSKPFLDYVMDLYNNVSTTIRYIVIPKPGAATQEGMDSPSSFVVITPPDKGWDFPYLKSSAGTDLWTLGMEGRLDLVAVSLSDIPLSQQAVPSDPP